LVVIDSAAALVPKLERSNADCKAAVLGSERRKLVAAARSEAAILVLNQTRIHRDRAAGPVGNQRWRAGLNYTATPKPARIAMAAAAKTVRFPIVKKTLGTAFATGDLQWIEGGAFAERP